MKGWTVNWLHAVILGIVLGVFFAVNSWQVTGPALRAAALAAVALWVAEMFLGALTDDFVAELAALGELPAGFGDELRRREDALGEQAEIRGELPQDDDRDRRQPAQ